MSKTTQKSGFQQAFQNALETGNLTELNEQLNVLGNTATQQLCQLGSSAATSISQLANKISGLASDFFKPKEEEFTGELTEEQRIKLSPMSKKVPGAFSAPFFLAIACFLLILSLFMFLFSDSFVTPILMVVAAVALLFISRKESKRSRYYRDFQQIFSRAPYASVKSLAEEAHLSEQKTRNYLQDFMNTHVYPKAEFVYQEKYVVLSPGAVPYLDYTIEKKNRIKKQQEEEFRLQEDFPKANEAVQMLASLQDTIRASLSNESMVRNLEMKKQLQQLDHTISSIETFIRENPEQLPDLRSFLNYFLPTVEKILSTYNYLDSQKMQTENIRSAKQEIESSLTDVNLAFENLYDRLFHHTTLDVSSDITVMQTLFVRSGLDSSDFQ